MHTKYIIAHLHSRSKSVNLQIPVNLERLLLLLSSKDQEGMITLMCIEKKKQLHV